MSDADWRALRDDFPALARHVYLNAAAASPTPRPVRAAVDTLQRQLEEDGDLHWDAWNARVEETRASVARLVNADADEIAFVPNTSAGINLIADLLETDGAVVTDTLEFPTVTLPWVHRAVPLRWVTPRADGALDPADFALARHPESATVLVSHVQFSNGCRQDLEAFGAVKGLRHLVVCGSQSAGAFPIDVRRARIDAFATAGHKWLCAGYGAGFCYIGRPLLARRPRAIGWLSVQEPFTFDNRRYELLPSLRRSELGCPAFAQIFALGAAADYLLGIGLERIAARVLALNRYLTDRLARIGVRVLSPRGAYRSGETLCAFADPVHVSEYLKAKGIHVTQKPEGIRVATHFYNDEHDVDRLIDALRAYRRRRGAAGANRGRAEGNAQDRGSP
jgi:cysteine desulfurase / selenocysteine lyase